MVKAGDKIRIVNAWMTNGRYKNGDVQTVKSVSQTGGIRSVEVGVYVSKKEYEVITDPPAIKVGDKVRLIDKPWESEVWGKLDRQRRAAYGKMIGKDIVVSDIYLSPAIFELRGIPCANTGVWFIPLALLERVEDKAAWPVKDERKAMEDRPYPEIKEGAQFVVLDPELWGHIKAGDLVTLQKNDGTRCPFFTAPDGRVIAIWWELLAPPSKHRYTPEQEQEARDIVYRLMMGLPCINVVKITCLQEHFLDPIDRINRDKPHTVARLLGTFGNPKPMWSEEKRAVSFCQPNDEWADDIGRMVAICKLLGEPLPKWVTRHG